MMLSVSSPLHLFLFSLSSLLLLSPAHIGPFPLSLSYSSTALSVTHRLTPALSGWAPSPPSVILLVSAFCQVDATPPPHSHHFSPGKFQAGSAAPSQAEHRAKDPGGSCSGGHAGPVSGGPHPCARQLRRHGRHRRQRQPL